MKRKVSECSNSDGQGEVIAASFDDTMVLINNGQIDRLNKALENNQDINSRNDDSLLMRACRLGEEDGVRALLSRGADVTLVSRYSGHSALSLASHYGYESIVKLLLEHGADPNFSEGRLPLIEACICNNLNVVEILANNGADLDRSHWIFSDNTVCNFCNNNDRTTQYHYCINALLLACKVGNIELVRLLVHRGAKTNYYFKGFTKSDSRGYGPLTFASEGYHWDIVSFLVTSGADINDTGDTVAYSKRHFAPLMYACGQGNIDVVRWLLRLGADINLTVSSTDTTYSPLYVATANGHLHLVKYILEHDQFNAYGSLAHAFVNACQKNCTELIEALRPYIPDLNASAALGETPLSIACNQGLTDTIKVLLHMGAAIDAPTHKNVTSTVLISACCKMNLSLVELLLANGASVNTSDYLGYTALSACCSDMRHFSPTKENTLLRLITLLVEHGADVNTSDNYGGTPLMSCIQREGGKAAVKLLLDYGADVTATKRNGKTVFDILRDIAENDGEFEDDDRLLELSQLCKQYEEGNRQALVSEPLLK